MTDSLATIAEARPRYLPFLSGKFRMAMGLVALDLDNWIEPDGAFAEELAEKDRLLAERYADVFAARPGSVPAQREVLDLLVEHMIRQHSDYLSQDGAVITVKPTGRRYSIGDFSDAPLDLAGRIAQEDFCLMAPGPEGYTLEAASLCFPARWRLAEKIGRPMAVIHDPVPGYGDKLARPVDRFFDHLNADRPVWRVNWSLNDDPSLYQPVRREDVDIDSAITIKNAGERLFLRCERQTLRRLPETSWILFTIKTYVDPVGTLAGRPDAAASLASAIRDLPRGTRYYKNVARYETALLGYLDTLADAA